VAAAALLRCCVAALLHCCVAALAEITEVSVSYGGRAALVDRLVVSRCPPVLPTHAPPLAPTHARAHTPTHAHACVQVSGRQSSVAH
jgi:hypothetical protein